MVHCKRVRRKIGYLLGVRRRRNRRVSPTVPKLGTGLTFTHTNTQISTGTHSYTRMRTIDAHTHTFPISHTRTLHAHTHTFAHTHTNTHTPVPRTFVSSVSLPRDFRCTIFYVCRVFSNSPKKVENSKKNVIKIGRLTAYSAIFGQFESNRQTAKISCALNTCTPKQKNTECPRGVIRKCGCHTAA